MESGDGEVGRVFSVEWGRYVYFLSPSSSTLVVTIRYRTEHKVRRGTRTCGDNRI